MKLNIKILFSFLLFFCGAFAATAESLPDERLSTILELNKHDTTKVNLLNDLFLEYEFNNPEKAKECLRNAFKIAMLSGYKKGLAKCYIYLGYFAQDQSNIELAIKNYNEALKLFQEIDDKSGIALGYTSLGRCHFEYSEYNKAINYFLKSLKIAQDIGDKVKISANLGNIGGVYLRQNDYPQALDYYFRALRIDDELGNKADVAIDLGNIGVIYTNMKQPLKALEYYTKAKEIDSSIDNKLGIASNLNNMGIAYSDMAEKLEMGSVAFDSLLKKALIHHQQALKLNEEVGNQNRLASTNNNIGTVYYDMYKAYKRDNALDSTFKYIQRSLKIYESIENMDGVALTLGNIGEIYAASQQYEKAEEYLQKTVALTLKNGFKETLSNTYSQLSGLYENMKQPEKALLYHKKHTDLKDSIFDETKSHQIAEMQTKFEVEKKEKELALFKEEQKLTAFKAYFLAVVLLLVSILAVLLINRQRLKIKRQREAHEIEQQLSQNQIERARLEKENLEANLKLNHEKLNHITDLFKEKSKLMDKMQEQLDKAKAESAEEKDVKTLLTSIEEYINPNEYWEEFITSFNLVNKNFFDQLLVKYPELTKNELRLCALVKCNLSNKEIANILNISPDSVKKSRNRLRKRLQLEADDSLTKYIQFLN